MTALTPELHEILQGILEKLVLEYAPQKVILFGSFARGNPGVDSDIDLLIIKETSERFIDRWTTVQKILTGMMSRILAIKSKALSRKFSTI